MKGEIAWSKKTLKILLLFPLSCSLLNNQMSIQLYRGWTVPQVWFFIPFFQFSCTENEKKLKYFLNGDGFYLYEDENQSAILFLHKPVLNASHRNTWQDIYTSMSPKIHTNCTRAFIEAECHHHESLISLIWDHPCEFYVINSTNLRSNLKDRLYFIMSIFLSYSAIYMHPKLTPMPLICAHWAHGFLWYRGMFVQVFFHENATNSFICTPNSISKGACLC